MVRIIVDSTCDMEREYLEKNNLTVVPLYSAMGDVYKTDTEITVEELYEWSDRHKTTPGTAAFSPGDVIPLILEAKEAGDEVIYIGISSALSACCNNFSIASELDDYDHHVYVVDSESVSAGQAFLIMRAVEMRDAGYPAPEIVAVLAELKSRIRIFFVVETLEYLHRGGRCSAIAAILGSKLRLKPCLTLKKGKIVMHRKYRGALSDCMKKLFKDNVSHTENADPRDLYIVYSPGTPHEYIEEMETRFKEQGYFENIHKTYAGAVVSSHCGPGTLGFGFIEK